MISSAGDPNPLIPGSFVAAASERHTLESLASVAGMSPRNLARHFVQVTGTTPQEFVERARVDAARMMLEGSDRPLKAVAFDCGFGSADRMRIVFSSRLGVTPVQYRASFRQNRNRSRVTDDGTAVSCLREGATRLSGNNVWLS